MRSRGCRLCVVSLMTALWAISIEAADYKRYDGVHRVEKKAQITQAPALERRADVCGTSSKQCSSSLGGGCCPNNYNCANKSCFATTRGPSTCGSKVGWYVCDAVYGGGCCPDGYLCETADNCVPASGSAYTFGCPASQYLCPPSLSYGCCPNGMACAVNQCYSTKPVTKTETMVITTTEDGSQTTYKTTQVTVSTPDEPTSFPTVEAGDDGAQQVLKYFPSAISQVSPSSSADDNGGGGGLSTGALAGIIAGSIAFLIVVLVSAFIIIRHLNKVVAAVSTPKQSEGSKSRPTMKEFKQTDSEVDALSVDPLMLPPRPSAPGPDSNNPSPYNMGSPDFSSNDQTPSGGVSGYHPVSTSAGNSRHTSFDAGGNDDYFNNSGTPRLSHQSAISAPTTQRLSNDSHGAYTHVRNCSNASDASDGVPGWNQATVSELEATPYVPELPHSPSSVVFPGGDRRRSSGSTAASTHRPSVSHSRQRNRSESLGQPSLGVVNEEMHGFYGSSNQLVGQTGSHRPGTGNKKLDQASADQEEEGQDNRN